MPQDGCLQYFTGLSGEFKTFNFDESSSSEYSHLASQDYNVCIRQEAGMCCVEYRECDDTSSWTLDTQAMPISTVAATTFCGAKELSGRVCGAVFTTTAHSTATQTSVGIDALVCSCSPPFTVGIVTDAAVDTGAITTAG